MLTPASLASRHHPPRGASRLGYLARRARSTDLRQNGGCAGSSSERPIVAVRLKAGRWSSGRSATLRPRKQHERTVAIRVNLPASASTLCAAGRLCTGIIVQRRLRSAVTHDAGQRLAEHDCIDQAGVHARAASRAVDVRRVAHQHERALRLAPKPASIFDALAGDDTRTISHDPPWPVRRACFPPDLEPGGQLVSDPDVYKHDAVSVSALRGLPPPSEA